MTSGSTTAKIKYKGKEDKKDVKVVSIPDTEAFTELIQNKVQKGNDIKLIQKQTNILLKISTVLVQFIPTIVILAMFIMLFKMQGFDGEKKNEKLYFRNYCYLGYWCLDYSCGGRSYFCKNCNSYSCWNSYRFTDCYMDFWIIFAF